MKIGISMGPTEELGDFGVVAQRIEELGFDSVWLPEHPVMPVHHNTKYPGTPDGSIPERMTRGVNPLKPLPGHLLRPKALGWELELTW